MPHRPVHVLNACTTMLRVQQNWGLLKSAISDGATKPVTSLGLKAFSLQNPWPFILAC